MFDRWMQYSYAAQKHQRHRLLKILFVFFILFVIYNSLVTFLVSVWTLDNDTMQPALASGDRLIFASSVFYLGSFTNKTEEQALPFKRGSIVLVDKGNTKERKIPLRMLDSAVRFFTAQQISLFSKEEHFYVKRVVALPGDEVFMNNFVFRVKPSGSPFSLTEFELAEKPYHPVIPNIPALWDDSIPFSGNMNTIILGPDECFVVSDDRGNTNDSRTWGPVSLSKITARAVLRFWPIVKFEVF